VSPIEYISKSAAAQKMGISTRRINDYAVRGQIRRRYAIDKQTRRKHVVYRLADVERLTSERQAVKDAAALIAAPASAKVTMEDTVESLTSATLLPSQGPSWIPSRILSFQPRPHEWLTLEEAARYTRLPISYLDGLIRAGKLHALDVGRQKGGRWRISPRTLDAISAEA